MISLKKSHFPEKKVYLSATRISNGHWSVPRALVKNKDLFPLEGKGLLALGLPVEWIDSARMGEIEQAAFTPKGELYRRSPLTLDKENTIVFISATNQLLFLNRHDCELFGLQEVRTAGPKNPAYAGEIIVMPYLPRPLTAVEKEMLKPSAGETQPVLNPHKPEVNPQPQPQEEPIMTTNETTPTLSPLATIVNNINDELRSLGKKAIQEVKMFNKEGKVIGDIRYGYKAYLLIEAVNRHLGPENWSCLITHQEATDLQAIATIDLSIKVDGEWIHRGQTGKAQIVKSNLGDAEKGAVTNATKKAFSQFGVGSDVSNGLLKAIYLGQTPAAASKHPKIEKTPEAPAAEKREDISLAFATPPANELASAKSPAAASPSSAEPPVDPILATLPHLKGVSYKRVNGEIIAEGRTYYERVSLRKAGFDFAQVANIGLEEKVWHLPVATIETATTH